MDNLVAPSHQCSFAGMRKKFAYHALGPRNNSRRTVWELSYGSQRFSDLGYHATVDGAVSYQPFDHLATAIVRRGDNGYDVAVGVAYSALSSKHHKFMDSQFDSQGRA